METTLERNSYGTLITNSATTPAEKTLLSEGYAILKSLAKKGKLEKSYDFIERDRKGRFEGDATHHEIYDITPTGTQILVCIHKSEGTKYGVKTLSKEYFLVAKRGTGYTVSPVSKAIAAKAAKSYADELGHGIAIVAGKEKLKGTPLKKRDGYKALTTDENGQLVSVWDSSPWPLGKTRIEKATDSHTGGFYYYKTLKEVITAATESDIFGDCREHKNLVIAKVQVSGYEYQHGVKLCATRIKPLELIVSIL